jgi:hypothetical protein
MSNWERVLGEAKFDSDSTRLKKLVNTALSRFPKDVPPLKSVTKIRMRKKGSMGGLVGLTTYCCVESEDGARQERRNLPTQRITFYRELLDQLSDDAAIGVIAHELVHSWLNEHTSPDPSKKRETEADELARKWGYGRYLDALEVETIPYRSPNRAPSSS